MKYSLVSVCRERCFLVSKCLEMVKAVIVQNILSSTFHVTIKIFNFISYHPAVFSFFSDVNPS